MSDCQAQIPGWAVAKLGDVTKPSRGKIDPLAVPDAPFIGMEHVEAHTTKLLGTVPARVMKSSANQFVAGDVLYGRLRPYLNKVYEAQFDGLCSGEFIVFPPTEALSTRILKYRLSSSDFVAFTGTLDAGDRPRVDFGQISDFRFALPPLREQARIADALDELFSDLDAAVASLERAREKLTLYRAAVLKAAVEGTLTAEWRAQHPGAEPASELLKRIVAERRKRWEEEQLTKFEVKGKTPPKGWQAKYREPVGPDISKLPELPAGWCWTTVSQVSALIQYGSSKKAGAETGGVPVLRMGNLTSDGRLDLKDLKYLPSQNGEFPALLLRSGDLLFNRTNSAELVGKTAVYEGAPEPCSFVSYLIRLRLLEGVEPRIVMHALNSALGRAWIRSVVNQTVGQANVNGSKLAGFVFPLPPHEEQAQILEVADEQLSIMDHLEADLNAKLTSAHSLRQAILRHAFSGKLVPQDPSDEPASELLKRVQAERESKQAPARKSRKPANRRAKTRR